jgi:hypothetical protein
MYPALIIGAIVLVCVVLYFVAGKIDARADRRIIDFLATYGLTYTSYNGAGCYANTVEKSVRKHPERDLSQWAIAVNEGSFQMGLYGGYPRDENDWPTFLGLPMLLDPELGHGIPDNGTMIEREGERATACYEAMASYRRGQERRAASDLAKRHTEEVHAIDLLTRALREVATDDTDLGRVIVEALAK